MKYGISNISIIPMRIEASDKSEMINQILFGEHFKILETRKKWSKIRLSHDNYEGWICNKQFVLISKEDYIQLDKDIPTITTDILDIVTKEEHQPIVIGSILPKYKSGHAIINNETGLLLKPDDDLYSSLKNILSDSKKIKLFNLQAKKRALKDFNWDVVIEKYLNIIRN